MPRPGPRPYECVKRAWHSDRHQPMRGLIIQQIFRLVHSNHSAGTKKNREYMEKLPVVVLKAEEIMYSKANSEAEYSEVDTLWDRVNVAIDTIIRKDYGTESEEFLPPCIEAALNLGCLPVRASRSQRNNNPRPYLRPIDQENSNFPRNISHENAIEIHPRLIPPHTANASIFKMPQSVDSTCLVLESNKHQTLDNNKGIASSSRILSCTGKIQNMEVGYNMSSVYPLYYDTCFNSEFSCSGSRESQKLNDIIIDVPVLPCSAECLEVGGLQNLFPCSKDKYIAQGTSQAYEMGSHIGCDLSLRLGSFYGSNSSMENVVNCGVESVVCRDSQIGGQPKDKEFKFFPVETSSPYDSVRMHTSNWNSELENHNAGVDCRKRKVPFTIDVDTEQYFWSDDPTSNHYYFPMKRPDL